MHEPTHVARTTWSDLTKPSLYYKEKQHMGRDWLRIMSGLETDGQSIGWARVEPWLASAGGLQPGWNLWIIRDSDIQFHSSS